MRVPLRRIWKTPLVALAPARASRGCARWPAPRPSATCGPGRARGRASALRLVRRGAARGAPRSARPCPPAAPVRRRGSAAARAAASGLRRCGWGVGRPRQRRVARGCGGGAAAPVSGATAARVDRGRPRARRCDGAAHGCERSPTDIGGACRPRAICSAMRSQHGIAQQRGVHAGSTEPRRDLDAALGPTLAAGSMTLPATETAMPTHVRACQRNPSNAAEITSATIGHHHADVARARGADAPEQREEAARTRATEPKITRYRSEST